MSPSGKRCQHKTPFDEVKHALAHLLSILPTGLQHVQFVKHQDIRENQYNTHQLIEATRRRPHAIFSCDTPKCVTLPPHRRC